MRHVRRAPEAEPLALELYRDGERVEKRVVPRGPPHSPFWEREDLWGPHQEKLLRELRDQLRRLERRLRELERRLDEGDVDRT